MRPIFTLFLFYLGRPVVLKYWRLRSRPTSGLVTKMKGDFSLLPGSGSRRSPQLLLPPRTGAERNPREAQKSRREWKTGLKKVRMPNYHSLISSFTRQTVAEKAKQEASETPQAQWQRSQKRKELSSARHKGLHGNGEFRPPSALFMQHFITKGPSHQPAQQILVF